MRHRTSISRAGISLSGTALISVIISLSSNPGYAAAFAPAPGVDTFVYHSEISVGGLTGFNDKNALLLRSGGTTVAGDDSAAALEAGKAGVSPSRASPSALSMIR
jgi:hypothetical protein